MTIRRYTDIQIFVLLGPFYGAIAVPSVMRCRCFCRGHRCTACDSGSVRQQQHLANGNVKLGRAAARSGEWAQHFSNASCYYYDHIISGTLLPR